MKHIYKFNKFFENIIWEWLDEEQEPLNFDEIQPYTMVKYGKNYFFIIGDFIKNNHTSVTHVYPDKIGKTDKHLLYDITILKIINKIDLLKILNKEIKLHNGYADVYKRYEYYFEEIYHLMSDDYKKYLNNKFDNILKEYGY